MRIRIVHLPVTAVVDGLDLRHFAQGHKYDVGSTLGALMLAEGWAIPVADDEAIIVPFSDNDPYLTRVTARASPTNLLRPASPSVDVSESRPIAPDMDVRGAPSEGIPVSPSDASSQTHPPTGGRRGVRAHECVALRDDGRVRGADDESTAPHVQGPSRNRSRRES